MNEREEAWLLKPLEIDTDNEPDRDICIIIGGRRYSFSTSSIRRMARANMRMPEESYGG